MARLMLCAYVLVTSAVTWFDLVLGRNHLSGSDFNVIHWTIPAVVCLAIVGLLDVLINDFLPPRVAWKFLHDRRHLLYVAIAFGAMMVSTTLAGADGWSITLLKYWLDATFSAGLAFLEMFPRHRHHNKRVCT
jgi:xanthosine utilization system XapX-like protein